MAPLTPTDRVVTASSLRPEDSLSPNPNTNTNTNTSKNNNLLDPNALTQDNTDAASVNSATPLTEDASIHQVNSNDDDLNYDVPPPTQPGAVSVRHTLTALTTSTSRARHYKTFAITPANLTDLHDPKSLKALYDIGGFPRLQTLLDIDLSSGIDESDRNDFESRIAAFGANRLPTKVAKSFFRLCYEAMKDKVLILLSVAALVSLALGLYETFGQGTFYDDEGMPIPKVDWVEGVAILVAVFIVVVVGAANDYQKERQFARLNAKKVDRDIIVMRGGQQKLISIYDLVVGDVINLQTGDVVPSDSILVQGEVECDESALTGESATIKKFPVDVAMDFYESKLPTIEDIGSPEIKFKDPYLISGSKVLEGLGNAVITAVGTNSIHGRTMMSLDTEAETTPLQERLDGLAEGISKYGFLAAAVLFAILLIRFGVNIAPGGKFNDYVSAEKGKLFMDILITAITIVVVAVPEGLPLAVTLALAFATTRMAQNGNLVRVLKACETMGGATTICSDKTGTLTENRMRIVQGFFGLTTETDEDNGKIPLVFDDSASGEGPRSTEILDRVDPNLKIFLCTNISLNSTAFENSEYDEKKAELAFTKPKPKSFFKKLFESQAKAEEEIGMGVVTEPYVGNKTESALLILADSLFNLFLSKNLEAHRQDNYNQIAQNIPFESSRKWSGVVMKIDGGFRLYVKGAAEIIFKNCGFSSNTEGEAVVMDRSTRDNCLTKIDEYANEALRAIALAHWDFVGIESWPPKEYAYDANPNEADPYKLVNVSGSSFPPLLSGIVNGSKSDVSEGGATQVSRPLTLDSIVGIQDPLKQGVPEAVLQCKRAGVSVRMVTGDNLITAKAISKSCYILTPDDLSNEFAFMEGPQFRKLSPKERKRIAPGLKVLARSSPEDKRILVDTLRKSGETVAVTGDGTNDAPALKLADVGFSMGISGTEVAREASDIILMTDDFNDIVQAIKWGRTVQVSIKKFIQFQLTVNITACVLTFVSAVASSNNKSVLTAVQLLWVNLIMDTLAALALATDKPDDSFLNKKPLGRNAPLISTSMWKMILGQSITQLIVTFVLHFAGTKIFFGMQNVDNHEDKQIDALVFNTFVWLQFWKLVVTRKLDEADDITTVRGRITRENLDFSQHLFRNWYFITIAVIIGGCQVLIMFVGGAAFSIARQTPGQWATAIICGFISIPVGVIIRIIPNWWVEKFFPTRAFNVFIYYVGFNFLKKKKKTEEEEEIEEPNLEEMKRLEAAEDDENSSSQPSPAKDQ